MKKEYCKPELLIIAVTEDCLMNSAESNDYDIDVGLLIR